MTDINPRQAHNTDSLPLSSKSSIFEWLHSSSVGATPYAAAYLAHLRSYLTAEAVDSADSTQSFSVYQLAGMIGRHSLSRQQHSSPEIDGIMPLQEVSESSIIYVAGQLNPESPTFRVDIFDRQSVLALHQAITLRVQHEITPFQRFQSHLHCPPTLT